jgi:purine nucleosidase
MDVDTGVDDALAILYVLASPEAELVALASTSGNVAAADVARNNVSLLELCGAEDVEVALGLELPLVEPLRTAVSHGPRGLGYAELPEPRRRVSPRRSAELVAAEARRRPGELVLVSTGPLTNVAVAVRQEPELPSLLRRLVIMGGAFRRAGNTSPVAEFNILVDPEAARAVFDAFSTGAVAPPLLCPLDVTETVALRPEHVRRLAELAGSQPEELLAPADRGVRSRASNPLVRCLSDAVRYHMEAYERFGYGYLSHMHDPLAAVLALEPALAETRAATVDVELAGRLTRGATIADWRGDWGRAPNVDVAVRVDADAVLERLVERLAALARQVAGR